MDTDNKEAQFAEDPAVRVLTKQEKEQFSGITIDSNPTGNGQGGNDAANGYRRRKFNNRSAWQFRVIKSGWLAGLVALLAAAFLVLFLLPAAVIMLTIFGLGWLLFRRR